MIGDLNRHVGHLIDGNHEKVSIGGKLIEEFLSNSKYVLVNGTNKVEGGPFTRIEPSDPDSDAKKSCLDLMFVSKSLFKFIDKVKIDTERKFTPCHALKKKVTYPDHYTMLMVMKESQQKKPVGSQQDKI